jgi:hypothetical protein
MTSTLGRKSNIAIIVAAVIPAFKVSEYIAKDIES